MARGFKAATPRGLWIRIQPSNSKSFWAIASTPEGKQLWTHIGPADIGIAAARETARSILQRVRSCLPPREPRSETFVAVAANWVQRHVEGSGLRSGSEIKRLPAAHVLPVWKDREFTSIRRNDVAALLDEVEDGHSAHQADAVLKVVREIANWYAMRHESYVPPFVRGMRCTRKEERERKRILSDPEICAVWKVAEANGTFGVLVRLLLLTAQRRRKVQKMRWQDVAVDGTWTTRPKRGRRATPRNCRRVERARRYKHSLRGARRAI